VPSGGLQVQENKKWRKGMARFLEAPAEGLRQIPQLNEAIRETVDGSRGSVCPIASI
jgi:hypothetical protein